MQGLFPLCREQFDSTCKVCLGHKSNCAFMSDQDPLPDGQGLPGLKGVWGYMFGQERLVTAASLLPWAASQACTVLEEFEHPYLAEWSS